jgi:hypothetical protein
MKMLEWIVFYFYFQFSFEIYFLSFFINLVKENSYFEIDLNDKWKEGIILYQFSLRHN